MPNLLSKMLYSSISPKLLVAKKNRSYAYVKNLLRIIFRQVLRFSISVFNNVNGQYRSVPIKLGLQYHPLRHEVDRVGGSSQIKPFFLIGISK
jgi:hypothetical protein